MRENLVRGRNNSSPWNLTWWKLVELRTSWSRWHVCCTPQITKKKITSRGQYKAQVLSRYHRSTQSKKQYISNNNIKSTTILNRWQQQVQEPLATTQAHLWGLKPPHNTHLGNRFFKSEYISIIQDPFSLLSWCRNVTLRSPQYSFILLSWCRNVTLRSPTILVSERDTPIPYYYVSVRDTRFSTILVSECETPIPYSTCRFVTPDPLISFFQFIKSSFIPRHHH